MQIEKRIIRIAHGYSYKYLEGIGESNYTPIGKSNEDNNTYINNTNNKDIVEILDYMNSICGTKYKSTTPKTKNLINSRIKEGFNVYDFKQVIDVKYKEWGQDKKMKKYLRPETLFGTKFESYLNQECQKQITNCDRKDNIEFDENMRQISQEIKGMTSKQLNEYAKHLTADL